MLKSIKKIIEKKETLSEAIYKSSCLNFSSKFLGYLRYLCIAIFLGFNRQTDAFFIAFGLLKMFMIFMDTFNSVGIPNLVRARNLSEEEYHNCSVSLMTLTLVMALLTTSSALLVSPFISKIAFGFSAHQQANVHLYFLLLIPELFFAFPFHYFGAILRSERKFTAYFLGDFIYSLTSTLTLFITLPWLHAAWCIPVAFSLAQIITTIYISACAWKFLHLKLKLDDQTKRIARQILSVLCQYAVVPVHILTASLFASYLPAKSISALYYGFMIARIPSGVLQFSNIAITSLSESEANWKMVKLYLRNLTLLSIPFIAGCWLFIAPVLKIFLSYGHFSTIDTGLTIEAVRYYILSLPFFLCWPILERTFQIKKKIFPLVLISSAGVIFNAALKALFIFHFHLTIRAITFSNFLWLSFLCAISYAYLSPWVFFKFNKGITLFLSKNKVEENR